jgi:hypothetical protein
LSTHEKEDGEKTLERKPHLFLVLVSFFLDSFLLLPAMPVRR